MKNINTSLAGRLLMILRVKLFTKAAVIGRDEYKFINS